MCELICFVAVAISFVWGYRTGHFNGRMEMGAEWCQARNEDRIVGMKKIN